MAQECLFGAARVGGKMAQQPEPHLGRRIGGRKDVDDELDHLVAHHCPFSDAQRREECRRALEGFGVESVGVKSFKGEGSEGRGA
jgi:hypothetical protein